MDLETYLKKDTPRKVYITIDGETMDFEVYKATVEKRLQEANNIKPEEK